jgi:hypothetical protein
MYSSDKVGGVGRVCVSRVRCDGNLSGSHVDGDATGIHGEGDTVVGGRRVIIEQFDFTNID